MRLCVCAFTLSNINISATSGPIATKFHLKHHRGGAKGCVRFWARSDLKSGFHGNRYPPNGHNGEYLVRNLAPTFLIGSSSFLQVRRTQPCNLGRVRISAHIEHGLRSELSLSVLKKFPYTYNGENLVSTLEPSFLIGSSSFLQVITATITAWLSLNFDKIPPLTAE